MYDEIRMHAYMLLISNFIIYGGDCDKQKKKK